MFLTFVNSFINRARNSNNVVEVFTFKTVESIVDDASPQSGLRFDSSNNELMLTIYRNEYARKVLINVRSLFDKNDKSDLVIFS